MAQLGATVSDGVIQEVARVTGTDALDLPPLYDVIDPEALDEMVDAMPDGEITFAYAGTVVTVQHNGIVSVAKCDADAVATESAETTETAGATEATEAIDGRDRSEL